MFYVDLFRCLHERKVRYLLAGGLAMNLRAVLRDIGDVPVNVACVGDMIALKANTGRRQDRDDVEHLKRLQG